MQQNEPVGQDDFISPEERSHLLSELHRFLVWVGEQIPEEFEANGETIQIHDIIWNCIHKKQISQREKERYSELVRMLTAKEESCEKELQTADLTREEAKRLYHESAALLRAIMDLKECEYGRVKLKGEREEIKKTIDDAKRWLGFLKTIGKK
jgi:poly-D-alanine transfer protein DltD